MTAKKRDDWATVGELARETGRSRPAVLQWLEQALVPSKTIGKRVMYSRLEALAEIDEHRIDDPKPKPGTPASEKADIEAFLERERQRSKVIEALIDCVFDLKEAIVANSPADEEGEIPDKCPRFTLEQGLWLMNELNKPLGVACEVRDALAAKLERETPPR